MLGIIIYDPLPYFPYYVCTYVSYGFVHLLLFIHVSSAKYDHLYHRIVRGCDFVQSNTFSRNIWSRDSVHARNVSRNIYARASVIIHARTFASILAHTSACLCVCA